VHIVDDVPELEDAHDKGSLTLVLVLDGFLDAGNAAGRAAQHLIDLGEGFDGQSGPVVATFDVDQFHDYRARRPAMSFVRDHYEGYDAPRLVVRLLRGSVPMAVPHTRPIAITHHANNPELLTGDSPWRGELRIPSSAQSLLEIRLGEWGHDALGFVAHIPHYLAQLDYPKASAALLEQVELAGRLTIDLSGLNAEAEDREAEIARYLASNEGVEDVVHALERQYDSFALAEESGNSLLAADEPMPTGEEIGQQFEQFLAGLDRPDPDTEQNQG